MKVDGGKSFWYRIRWWISRMDVSFNTHHWLDDQQLVRKRKTELGGALSVASWILFIGLLSALLYQVFTKRKIEVHKVRPVNAPDLLSFNNDMEFNITTVSSMSCAHLRGLSTVVLGTPGFIDHRVYPLSTYATAVCQNRSTGPTISLRCNNCRIPRRNFYISWQFVDLPNDPALAVGFEFILTVKDHENDKYVSFVSGSLQADNYIFDKPITYRGPDLNILKVHLFPQIYNYLHDLKLVQPLFHDFVPGSYFSEINDLKNSLQRPTDGLINTTLDISFLSDYIVEIDRENVMGPVSVLANIGGLYAVSIAIFLYLLLQLEARIKGLQNEDTVMREIRSQRRAQKNWEKLRKYVFYTWGPSNMNIENQDSLVGDTLCGLGSSHKIKQVKRNDSILLELMNDSQHSPSSRTIKSNTADGERKKDGYLFGLKNNKQNKTSGQ